MALTPFLLLPGSAPIERGRAPARRPFSKRPSRSLPDYSRRLSDGCHFLEGDGSKRRDSFCWHASCRKDAVRSIHSDSSVPPRSGAGGRRRERQAGPTTGSGEGAAQRDRIGTHSRSLCWRGGGHSLPGAAASGRRCGKLGFRRDGELRDRSSADGLELGKGRPTLPLQMTMTIRKVVDTPLAVWAASCEAMFSGV